MKKLIFAFILFVASASFAQTPFTVTKVYTLDFTQVASAVEQAPDACTVEVNGGSADLMTADCEIVIEGADQIFVSYDSVSDVLGTHASANWDVNIRAIADAGDSYPATGTDPTDTNYHEEAGMVDGQYGGFALTPGPYAIKVRVDENGGAQIAAPTVKVKVTWFKR